MECKKLYYNLAVQHKRDTSVYWDTVLKGENEGLLQHMSYLRQTGKYSSSKYMPVCNLSMWEVRTEKGQVQGQPGLIHEMTLKK